MKVTFADTQIIRTSLIPGVLPEDTAASFDFLSLDGAISSVMVDPSSPALSAPVGITEGGPGASIVLDVTAMSEPSTCALMGVGLLSLAWMRRGNAAR